ncbi:MAG: 2-phosphosulfolactate phosphatase [Bacteroidales bacterium]|nr:2-phosphosulfolactate phosphatase [Bacteroidales bacterium]
MYSIETCLSPALWDERKMHSPFTVIIVDIFRATTCFCTALYHGAAAIIPVNDLEYLQQWHQKGYITAAERGGKKVDFADFGNDPNAFITPLIVGKEIAYSTTNGTVAIEKALQSGCRSLAIASFLNLSSIVDFIVQQSQNVLILCAGWQNQCSFEDTFFAGALTERLLQYSTYATMDDATKMALFLWEKEKNQPMKTLENNSSHLHRLLNLGITNTLPYAIQEDICPVVPRWKDDKIVV